MRKSLFTRYILAFLVIVVVGFSVLGLMISGMVANYSVSTKRTTIVQTADSVSSFMVSNFSAGGTLDFNRYVYYNWSMCSESLHLLAANSEQLVILILDKKGNILVDSASGNYTGRNITLGQIENLLSEEDGVSYSDLSSLLAQRNLICARPIYVKGPISASDAQEDNDTEHPSQTLVGYTLVCSPSDTVSGLTQTVLKTVFLSTLWVALATLIVVYFITERISSPLREMSRAAKEYAAGKFDVRVPVKGKDEIAELAVAFNNMATSLQNLENMRSSFVSNVSHELRTPMTSIAGFIDGILSGAIPQEKQGYYLQLVYEEVLRLSRLVTTLLDLSRIQAGDRKFVSTNFDIAEMARQILISFENRIEQKHLNVEFDCAEDRLMAYADRDAIYQVLYNICDNAVKFSKEGGVYRISLLPKDKKIFVSVYNEGIGISPQELPMIFDRFYKSDKSRGLDKKGVGLGMYITKTIIDAHGQEIWVKSEYGSYCEFTFTLQQSAAK